MVTQFLRAAALLAVTVGSITLFALELQLKNPTSFFGSNELGIRLRHLHIIQILGAAVLTVVLAGAYAIWRRQRAVDCLTWLARLSLPLVLLPLMPPLLKQGYGDSTQVAVALAAFVLLYERFLNVSLLAWDRRPFITARWARRLWSRSRHIYNRPGRLLGRIRPYFPTLCVLLGVVLFAGFIGVWTLWSHRRFGTYGYDLGQFDNLFYSALRGRPLRVAPLMLDENWQELRNHAHFGIYTLLPFYALRPVSETLLILQAVIVALGAIPLFLFARRRLPGRWAAVVALAYLLYAPLHGGLFYDFHFQPIAAVYVLTAIYFVDSRRWFWYWLFFFMALSCREDISIGLCLLGLTMLLTDYRPRTGAVTALLAAVYFVVMRFGIMKMFGPWWFSDIYKDLYPQGDSSFGGVIKTLISNPGYALKTLISADKLRYFLQILVPLAFLPLRRPYLLVALVPGFILTLLTTGYGPTIDISFQYAAGFIAYAFPAAALALASFTDERDGLIKRRAAGLTLALAAVMANLIWGAFSPRHTIRGGFADVPFTRPTKRHEIKRRHLQELAAMVPRDATVGISETEMPHVPGQLNVRTLRDGLFDAEYLLYDTTTGGGGHADAALARGEYVEVARRAGLRLLRKKAQPATPDAGAP